MSPTLIGVMLAAARRSSRRWSKLSVLLLAVERGVEAAARLDAHTTRARFLWQPPPVSAAHAETLAFERRLRALERRIGSELDRLTVERLILDLTAKQAAPSA